MLPDSDAYATRLMNSARSDFEQDQLNATTERLAKLESTIDAEQATLARLEEQKTATLHDITEIENAIAALQDELKGLNDILEDKTKTVDQVKRTTSKAAKGLDQALKEISSKVSLLSDCILNGLTTLN